MGSWRQGGGSRARILVGIIRQRRERRRRVHQQRSEFYAATLGHPLKQRSVILQMLVCSWSITWRISTIAGRPHSRLPRDSPLRPRGEQARHRTDCHRWRSTACPRLSPPLALSQWAVRRWSCCETALSEAAGMSRWPSPSSRATNPDAGGRLMTAALYGPSPRSPADRGIRASASRVLAC